MSRILIRIFYTIQTADLEAEFNRINRENQLLRESLKTMIEKYNALQSQMNELIHTSSSEGGSVSPSRKRKSTESFDTAGRNEVIPPTVNNVKGAAIVVMDQMECTSGENHEPFKRIREDCKPKMSKSFVRADPSDVSLVRKSWYDFSIFFCYGLIWEVVNFLILRIVDLVLIRLFIVNFWI